MALHLLNCSVDTPDQQPAGIPEDLTHNELESILEIILEEVFHIDNAIAEADENDQEENSNLTTNRNVDFYVQQKSESSFFSDIHPVIVIIAHNEYNHRQFQSEIIPPPPKV